MWMYTPESEKEARELREEYLAANPARDQESFIDFRARIREYIKAHASEHLLREMEHRALHCPKRGHVSKIATRRHDEDGNKVYSV